LFEKPAHNAAFQHALAETLDRFPMRILQQVHNAVNAVAVPAFRKNFTHPLQPLSR
jgi:hypothetical protein